MTINHVYNKINSVMEIIDSIDMMSLDKRKENQKLINQAYTELDNFKDELIRENIIIQQKRRHKRYDD